MWITDIPVPSATWCSLYSNWGNFLEIPISECTRNVSWHAGDTAAWWCHWYCHVKQTHLLPHERIWHWSTEIRPLYNLTISLCYQWLRQGVPKISGPPGIGRDLVTPQLTVLLFMQQLLKGLCALSPLQSLGSRIRKWTGLNRWICGRNPVTFLAAVQYMQAWFLKPAGQSPFLIQEKKPEVLTE